jgi:hypothetical protein
MRQEGLAAARLRAARPARRRRLRLRRQPGVEGRVAPGHHVQRHARVLLAAEFGALPAVGAGLVGLQQQVLHAARHHVHLAGQRGTQKLWITSALDRPRYTGRPAGMRISLA